MLENLAQKIGLAHEQSWVLSIFVIVLGTLLFEYAIYLFVKKVEKRAEITVNVFDDALVHAIRKPLRLVIWTLGLWMACIVIFREKNPELIDASYMARDVLLIFATVWFSTRFVSGTEQSIIEHRHRKGKGVDLTAVKAIGKIIRASVIITGFLIILQRLGFSISAVLAFGGIGGLAIGFAAKDLLANFFGALMIYLDRPFKVGDWVRSPDKNIEGTVEDIGWRLTRIRTFDKRPLYVPNAVFSTIAVENPSRMSNRRIYENIGVRYEDAARLNKIVKDVKAMLTKHKEIDENLTLIVNVNQFAASSIDFFIYCFTHTTDWIKFHEIKHEILLNINNIIEKHGAEIAFPTSTIHIADTEPFPSS